MRRRAVGATLPENPGAAAEKLRLARSMRSAPTKAEAMLWLALRRRAIGGWKFRRQQVIAGYIVDFYCAEACLALEVDGSAHDERVAADRQRDAALLALGLRVVRVTNEDVIDRLESVLDTLERALASLAYEPYRKP